mmetsp:Transcript_13594/g.31870  ORF Transcript_13594/g.31870 Transcript_13594/m.31870 type:complete len:84 (-) Transcript_13594:76-327(-)
MNIANEKTGYLSRSDVQKPYDCTTASENVDEDSYAIFSILVHRKGSMIDHSPSKTPFKAKILQKSFNESFGLTIILSYFPGFL